MKIKSKLKKILMRIPYCKFLNEVKEQYYKGFAPGHYYSPIVNPEEVNYQFEKNYLNEIDGFINLNTKKQKELIEEMLEFKNSIPFKDNKQNDLYYYYNNKTFSYSDAIFLYFVIRKFKPRKIIEVGSGFSTAVMYDTNKLFFNSSIDIINIDPETYHLNKVFEEKDLKKFIRKKVQQVEVEIFEKLYENDILFIDSSHVSKCGSDLNYILFNIIPFLKKGVIIHFHDIYFPFEYPKAMVLDDEFFNGGFGWNEIYLIKSFLMYNNNFEILLWDNYLLKKYNEFFKENLPICLKNYGGSLWLKKIK